MSTTPNNVCSQCGLAGVSDPKLCPNCNTDIPRVRKGDLSAAGWVLVIIVAIVIGLVAGLSGHGNLVDAGLAVVIVIGIGLSVAGALKAKKRRAPGNRG